MTDGVAAATSPRYPSPTNTSHTPTTTRALTLVRTHLRRPSLSLPPHPPRDDEVVPSGTLATTTHPDHADCDTPSPPSPSPSPARSRHPPPSITPLPTLPPPSFTSRRRRRALAPSIRQLTT
ncbi:hypothetical protein EV363DRAFT_1228690 [Boletus edulis]|uniref:Uncharacterized protein n=1 Tax=Boletus edulis BED1 TaxID=1328754 RepID=A0AAD4BSH0_BOLED|nr:hypothetical protein EV363DRAFT_1228690 [Boletus edulis]KAF8439008.1 hypothetical protein L210DRAFT_3646526 [Boletus edulis BED1]